MEPEKRCDIMWKLEVGIICEVAIDLAKFRLKRTGGV